MTVQSLHFHKYIKPEALRTTVKTKYTPCHSSLQKCPFSHQYFIPTFVISYLLLFIGVREVNHCGIWNHEEEHNHPYSSDDETRDDEGKAPVVGDKGCCNQCTQNVAKRGVRVPDTHDQTCKDMPICTFLHINQAHMYLYVKLFDCMPTN